MERFSFLHKAITSATLKHKYTDNDKPNDSHDIKLDYEVTGGT